MIAHAVAQRVGTLIVGDPRGVLNLSAGRRHNLRLRQWRVGQLIAMLTDKATLAGITVHLVDERGTSSTCPKCLKRISKPSGRITSCRDCGYIGHPDLTAAAIIATRDPRASGPTPTAPGTNPVPVPVPITHRRAGRHLPGAGRSRRDPRRHTRDGTRVRWPAVARPEHSGSRSPDGEDLQPTPDIPLSGQR